MKAIVEIKTKRELLDEPTEFFIDGFGDVLVDGIYMTEDLDDFLNSMGLEPVLECIVHPSKITAFKNFLKTGIVSNNLKDGEFLRFHQEKNGVIVDQWVFSFHMVKRFISPSKEIIQSFKNIKKAKKTQNRKNVKI